MHGDAWLKIAVTKTLPEPDSHKPWPPQAADKSILWSISLVFDIRIEEEISSRFAPRGSSY